MQCTYNVAADSIKQNLIEIFLRISKRIRAVSDILTMRASLNTCLQTDSQLNEGVENDVHGQKKVQLPKKSIYILDTVSTARR